jgi:hypothetical protein
MFEARMWKILSVDRERTQIALIFPLNCSWHIIVVQTLNDIIIITIITIIIILSSPYLELRSV